MKIALVLVLCLAAGSQANFLDDLKNAFSNIGTALTTTVHAVGDQAKVVGQNLLTTAKEQGSQLASQALQSERILNCTQLKRPAPLFVVACFHRIRNVCCLALLPNAVIWGFFGCCLNHLALFQCLFIKNNGYLQ